MTTTATSLTIAELEGLLRAANPGAILLPPRRLRRVIKEDREISGLGLQVPHQRSYTITRDRLLRLVPREELGLMPDQHLPATLLLLVRPDTVELEDRPRQTVLRRYWRLLYHARIHAALDRQMAEGQLTPDIVAAHISRIGSAAFSEIRLVLEQERYLLPPVDDATVYMEFVAVYLEFRAFAPHLLSVYFPTIDDFAAVESLLAEDVDATSLLAETQPAGINDPVAPSPDHRAELVNKILAPPEDSERFFLAARAHRAARKGNLVRAARLQQRAGNAEEARAAIERLVQRLQAALDLDRDEMAKWRTAVEPLLIPASEGPWPAEARLLYDLQKVCIDRERAVYAVDVVEWVYSMGERPIKRPLPGQTEVLQLKYLRTAARRAAVARIAESSRRDLELLLHDVVERGEQRTRETFRPRLAEVLREVGMRPGNVPEQVALHKITEELLDRAVERGYLRMGDLRDAVSRNNLRLPDLSGPREFFRGDKLIRANRRLPVLLDGVYRRGEFYLRWLQRLSSLAFGTSVGRALVLYALLPFGGAFLTVEGVHHIVVLAAKLIVTKEPVEAIPAALVENPVQKPVHFHTSTFAATLVLGLVLLGLIHSAVFRRLLIQLLGLLGRLLYILIVDTPGMLLNLAAVRWLFSTRIIVWFARYAARPTAVGLSLGLLSLMFLPSREALVLGVAALVAGCFFFNSRLAVELEEAFLDGLARLWLRFSIELIPALFHFIMAGFKRLLEALDRLLYTVDEWLRFRTGDSRWTFVWKMVLGILWFVVSYVIRLYVNLFIEPTTNPIKHFPVVTVAAKIMAPFLPKLIHDITVDLTPFMNPVLAGAIAGLHAFILPGIFGFLAWELKENWRLYRKNQPKTLRPVAIGHHGETLHGLLKLGFHSGTVPKLYRRLRRAERRADTATARKQREMLHHAAEAVRSFTERDLIYLLELCRAWEKRPIHLGPVRLGCTSIRLELVGSDDCADRMEIQLEERTGLLVASITREGWLKYAGERSRQAFAAALAGWYRMADVNITNEHESISSTSITWEEWLASWEDGVDAPVIPPHMLPPAQAPRGE